MLEKMSSTFYIKIFFECCQKWFRSLVELRRWSFLQQCSSRQEIPECSFRAGITTNVRDKHPFLVELHLP